LGVMDYYRLQNIKADTQMRESIGKPTSANTNSKNEKNNQ